MSSVLSPVDFPLGNSTLWKEHCKKVGKPIKMYCHFLPNTQSQTQAVTECLHCLLQSTGSPPASDAFETNLPTKTWPGASADKQKEPGSTAPGEESLGGPRQTPGMGHTPKSAPVTAIEGWRTCHPQHNTPLPQATQSFNGWKCFHGLCCSQAKQHHGLQVAGTGSSQHTCKVSKGYHTARSVTPCETRLARQAELVL